MDPAILKQFADFTRFEEPQIKDLWEKPYVVISAPPPLAVDVEDNPVLIIHTFSIPKRNNPQEVRNIYYPHSQVLKIILKITSSWLNKKYTPPEAVHGFVRNRGIKSNAEQHLSCNYLLKLDIENYYEQISKERIEESLIKIGIQEDNAKLISKITTVEGKLIQGFSTSPVISNIVSTDLDMELMKYCLERDIKYTRYADDMAFSSSEESNAEEIKAIIINFGFVLNEGKTRVLKRGFYQSVTGLTIFDSDRPRIPKRIKKKLRLEVYYINKYGIKNHAIRRLVRDGDFNKNPNVDQDLAAEINYIRERLEGWINYTKGIEPEFSSKIQKKFEER